MGWIAWTGLHGLDCMGWTAWGGLHGLDCMDWTAWTGLHGVDCMDWTAWGGYYSPSCTRFNQADGPAVIMAASNGSTGLPDPANKSRHFQTNKHYFSIRYKKAKFP